MSPAPCGNDRQEQHGELGAGFFLTAPAGGSGGGPARARARSGRSVTGTRHQPPAPGPSSLPRRHARSSEWGHQSRPPRQHAVVRTTAEGDHGHPRTPEGDEHRRRRPPADRRRPPAAGAAPKNCPNWPGCATGRWRRWRSASPDATRRSPRSTRPLRQGPPAPRRRGRLRREPRHLPGPLMARLEGSRRTHRGPGLRARRPERPPRHPAAGTRRLPPHHHPGRRARRPEREAHRALRTPRGLVSTGRKRGKRAEKLRKQGGWAANSPVFWEYVDEGERCEDTATEGIGR